MSGDDGNTLKLEIKKKCGNTKTCTCGTKQPKGVTAKREDLIDDVKGFVALVHSIKKGRTFKLSKNLGNGESLEDGITVLYGVTKVSVYYWVGDASLERPLLLERDNSGHKSYYYKYDKSEGPTPTIWKLIPDKLTLQERLDDRNCGINNAVVFNIENSESGSLPNNSKSDCIKSRKIELGDLKHLSGSNYVSKTHKITGLDGKYRETRISRVTLNDRSTDLTPPIYPVDQIRLYSYQGSGNVPLMIEFIEHGTKKTTFYESTDQGHLSWREVGNGNSFYDGDESNLQPTGKLSEQLDEILCTRHDNVTLDITPGRHNGDKYCCGTHKGTEGRISVREGSVKVRNNPKLSVQYYQHTVTSGKLGGIYYKDSGSSDRNNIKLHGLTFPISGVRSVYTFYCKEEGPSLIYVDSPRNLAARGWYKKGYGENWTWISELIAINSNDIESGLTCVKWRKLRNHLTGPTCSYLSDCSYTDPNKADEDKKQLQQEEQEAIKERDKAIEHAKQRLAGNLVPPAVVPPSPSDSSVSSSSGSSSEERSMSHSSGYSPPEVIINLSEKSTNIGEIKKYKYPPSGKEITVTRSSYQTDFLNYKHKDSNGGGFTLKEVQDDSNAPIVIPKEGDRKVTSVSAYYWTGNTDRALLVGVTTKDGNTTTYYRNTRDGVWSEYKAMETPSGGPPAKEELDLLNCEINDVVQIDVAQITDYCHDDNEHLQIPHDTKKVKVSEILGSYKYLGNYVAYAHTPNSDAYTGRKSHKFNISGFTNGKTPITLSGLHLPVMGVQKVILYFCEGEVNAIRSSGKSVNNPLLIYLPNSDQGERWFKKPDSGTEWTLVNKLNGKECFDNAVVDFLDTVESICRPPEVTINIYNRTIGNTYAYGDDFGRWITVEDSFNSNIDCFTEYTHREYGRKNSYFTVKKFKYGGNEIESGLESVDTPKVTKLSVFYWTALENDSRKGSPDERGRPLLVKITTHAPGEEAKEIYYENVSSKPGDHTQWKLWKGFPPEPKELENELELLNCNINNVVNIKVNQTKGFYCGHLNSHNPGRVKVEGMNRNNLGKYKAYKHEPNMNPVGKVHISDFKDIQNKTLTGLPTSVLDVKKVVVYFCGKSPLLLYIDSNDPNITSKWFQKPNNGTEWLPVNSPPPSEKEYSKIVEILDKLKSGCAPPSVTIDIYQRDPGGHTKYYKYDSGSNRVLVTGIGNNPSGFTEYKHTDNGASKNTFTVSGFEYNKEKVKAGLSGNTHNVISVSVFHWTALEDDLQRRNSRPLLVKITQKKPGQGFMEKWYENDGNRNNTGWTEWWMSTVSEPILQSKLCILNCKLNQAVVIDISKQDTVTYDTCKDTHLDSGHSNNDKIKVDQDKEDMGKLRNYQVYRHTLNSGGGPFHILSFKNAGTTLSGIGPTPFSPILDVSEVRVYFCSLDNKPLLLYYKANGQHYWYKNNKPTSKAGQWVDAGLLNTDGPENHEKILNVLNSLESECKDTPKAESPLPTVSQGETESTEESPKHEASTALEAPVIASIAGYFLTGSAGAGGLTGLGWWMFKRSKGDPWVIHGYSIECLKNVPH
ncbi:hypothetical protein BEWA_046270 [Theileria equi strain WA]|uniref:Uncharacterized protein n=1 Tax=Theileria equi strain WA TaxID=1537102 RepID=L1LAG2_THEEQ|nr:hypothetical protein BEWA_046270 [Theileria equi strain WA]EKX72163.1 hypothetical protein BEWA_046270 [Theileria equi strain WA]|eukprot:XP_004831615.1 hypothetical protein BEWA_046270 [Theileria equi strain WA]